MGWVTAAWRSAQYGAWQGSPTSGAQWPAGPDSEAQQLVSLHTCDRACRAVGRGGSLARMLPMVASMD